MLVTSLLGLLKGRQTSFVDKYAQLLIRESSDMGATSSDDELSDWGKKPTDFIGKMASHGARGNRVDKNLF